MSKKKCNCCAWSRCWRRKNKEKLAKEKKRKQEKKSKQEDARRAEGATCLDDLHTASWESRQECQCEKIGKKWVTDREELKKIFKTAVEREDHIGNCKRNKHEVDASGTTTKEDFRCRGHCVDFSDPVKRKKEKKKAKRKAKSEKKRKDDARGGKAAAPAKSYYRKAGFASSDTTTFRRAEPNCAGSHGSARERCLQLTEDEELKWESII
jgi:hypothetical protein